MNDTSPLVPPDYDPNDRETFMNPLMQEFFRRRLLEWKGDIVKDSNSTLNHLQEENKSEPDLADRASRETDRAIELRTRDRERKLLSKIDAALKRLEEGTYGYCAETDERISIMRLKARPIATLSLEAQELHERKERLHRDE
ncbi:MAG TPA: RNA polymerase-binding protein DksA [Alphaproteobacteria bacterium]|nr:RNA polymerase-binding protein DksA [Alphaproteobacteria bacterium]